MPSFTDAGETESRDGHETYQGERSGCAVFLCCACAYAGPGSAAGFTGQSFGTTRCSSVHMVHIVHIVHVVHGLPNALTRFFFKDFVGLSVG